MVLGCALPSGALAAQSQGVQAALSWAAQLHGGYAADTPSTHSRKHWGPFDSPHRWMHTLSRVCTRHCPVLGLCVAGAAAWWLPLEQVFIGYWTMKPLQIMVI